MIDKEDLLNLLSLRLTAIDDEIPLPGDVVDVLRLNYLAGSRDSYQEIYDLLTGKVVYLKPVSKNK